MLKRLRLLAILAGISMTAAPIPLYTYRIVHVYPHDPDAFTEGLFYRDGYLYEATGLTGHSSVRKVRLQDGKVVQSREVPRPYFGEGIVAWKNRLIQLTYTTEVGFVMDLATFRQEKTFRYQGQGWSLTTDGKRIIMDDGTPDIRFWDPETLNEISRITVRANGMPIESLNELEWVRGEIFANVWHTDRIARIDPATGEVRGWIDLTGLLPQSDVLPAPEGTEQVLNGIAYDAKGDRLFVTGKYWPKLFEIQVLPKQ